MPHHKSMKMCGRGFKSEKIKKIIFKTFADIIC